MEQEPFDALEKLETDLQHSETLNEIAAALAKAQATLAHAKEDASNPHFRSAYATLASVIDASRAPLAAAGLAVVQAPYNAPGGLVGVITMLVHTSGQWFKSKVAVRPARFEAQALGSVVSYLRRYSLLALIRMSQSDDDGELAVPSSVPAQKSEAKKKIIKEAEPEEAGVKELREEFARLKASIYAAPNGQALKSLHQLAQDKLLKIKEKSEEAHGQLEELFHTRGKQLGE